MYCSSLVNKLVVNYGSGFFIVVNDPCYETIPRRQCYLSCSDREMTGNHNHNRDNSGNDQNCCDDFVFHSNPPVLESPNCESLLLDP